eukprot:1063523-Pyramimonas_sp.AAC.1
MLPRLREVVALGPPAPVRRHERKMETRTKAEQRTVHAWIGVFVRSDHAQPSVTLAPHWRPSRQCRKTGWNNFGKGVISCLPLWTDAATPAS